MAHYHETTFFGCTRTEQKMEGEGKDKFVGKLDFEYGISYKSELNLISTFDFS